MLIRFFKYTMENLEYTALRKRTTPFVGRPRERSVEPKSRKVQFVDTTDPLMDGWELFKDEMMTKFPNIKFPDEYCDTDVITSSVSGIGVNIHEVMKKVPSNVNFTVQQDGRLVVEFTKPDKAPVVKKSIQMPSRKIIVIIIWLFSLIAMGAFIKLNFEKYKKLLWT